jgi:hypothetical protein
MTSLLTPLTSRPIWRRKFSQSYNVKIKIKVFLFQIIIRPVTCRQRMARHVILSVLRRADSVLLSSCSYSANEMRRHFRDPDRLMLPVARRPGFDRSKYGACLCFSRSTPSPRPQGIAHEAPGSDVTRSKPIAIEYQRPITLYPMALACTQSASHQWMKSVQVEQAVLTPMSRYGNRFYFMRQWR